MPFETTTVATDILHASHIFRAAGPDLASLSRRARLHESIPTLAETWVTICDTIRLPGLSTPAVVGPTA